ncbi:MAG: nuclear transport factor 2 family protein [Pseudomonadota bacterium]
MTGLHQHERSEVIDVVNRVALLADAREWDALATCFDAEVEVDYTSEFGGAVKRLTPSELMREWAWLGRFRATQHDVTSHVVDIDGEHARCRAHVRSTHFADGERGEGFWTCWGNYDYRLRRTEVGWKVASTRFTLTAWRGNPEINAEARGERV